MNTNSNTYTVIYSTVLVILVAAILAFVAMSLQDKQNENIKIETISKVLNAATQSIESVGMVENTDVISMYTRYVESAFYVDGTGRRNGDMNIDKENPKNIKVATTSDLKKQNDIIKKIEDGSKGSLEDLSLPVYVFDFDGETVTVVPCYGAGLWGPIWGYIAIAEDGKTVDGAIFDHKSETPGLGAKISEEPFYSKFKGKTIGSGDELFAVRKTGTYDIAHGVDAISGATITSQALGKSINLWLKYYQPYFAATAVETAASETAEVSGGEAAVAEDLPAVSGEAAADDEPVKNVEE